ncbi:MAG: AbrB family transcriptional regulator [Thermobacillus sp. ZCTH02-B1]|nr:MAG: AbrB family transcriptional regulator [Thermobacillus sp. ZCTH02-B1]
METGEVIHVKPAGVVRKVDQLGRIVLPKSLRKRYQMNEGDPVEILVQGDHIILERYRPRCVFCGSMEQVREYKERHLCANCVGELIALRK